MSSGVKQTLQATKNLVIPQPSRMINSLIVLFIFVFSMAQFHWTQFRSSLDLTPGDLGDPRFININLEHGYQWLIGTLPSSFWSPLWMFFPQENTLTQSDVLIGAIFAYAPFRLIGLNEFLSFQCFIIACGVLNFIATFLLARSMKVSPVGSALAASIFAYALCRSGYSPHPQLLTHWWTPLGLYFAILSIDLSPKRVTTEIKSKSPKFTSKSLFFAFMAGMCASLQFWSAFYLGFFCVISALAIGTFLILFHFKETLTQMKRHTWQTVVFLLSATATTTPLALAYLDTARNFGTRPSYMVIGSMPKILAWLTPPPSSLFYGWLYKLNEHVHNNHMEYSIFQGTAPTLCFFLGIIYCLRNKKNADPMVYRIVFVITALFLFFTRIGPDTIWKFFMHITPGATAIRAMARIGLLMLLPSGIITGIMYDKVAAFAKNKANHMVLYKGFPAVLLIFALCEQIDNKDLFFSIKLSTDRINVLVSAAKATCENKPLVIQTEGQYSYVEEIDTMWASILTGIPNIVGYSGLVHPKYAENKIGSTDMTTDSLRAWLKFFGKADDYCLLKPIKAQSSIN